jgi:CDP-diacylglycerol---glycerol-3-phosphate 3-phosphatidyltransferase
MAGVLGAAIGGERRYDGPMGKSDRAALFGALGLAAGVGVPMEPALNWIWMAVIALLALTIVNRIRRGMAASA